MCCILNPKFKSNDTIAGKYEARKKGDLNIMYDVLSAYEGNYLAQVSMENHHPLGRLDNWNLTWEWKRGEFIHSMKGAVAVIRDPSDCIYGPAGVYYNSLDFGQVMTCEKKPIIADLPPERAKDNQIGNIPNCCKNGTLLPAGMDPSMSKAAFQMLVYKVPPELNRTALSPPQNWRINGVVNPDYKCGPPERVRPSEFPDPSGLISVTTAVASWQVVCNITRPKTRSSRCCVSFSAYYNDSVVPCNTCACGCPAADSAGPLTCNADSPAMLLPSEALLVPFDNRTEKAKAWAKIKHLPLPARLPCGDNCGVSINWHVYSDYRKGWTARITIFNWDKDYTFKDWFTAVEMDRAFPGYENVYSFNGTKLPELDSTLFFQGLPGLNFLMAQTNGSNPKVDPPVPGKQQSVISFTKKQTPGINIARGDGFPRRVFFNGEECELPRDFPRSSSPATRVDFLYVAIVAALGFVLLLDV